MNNRARSLKREYQPHRSHFYKDDELVGLNGQKSYFLNEDVVETTTNNLDTFIEATLERMTVADDQNTREMKFNKRSVKNIACKTALVIFILGYLTYIGFVLYLKPKDSVFVCIIAVFVCFIGLNQLFAGKLKRSIRIGWAALYRRIKPRKKTAIWIRRVITVVAALGILAFLVYDLWGNWKKWTPLSGFLVFLLVSVVFSENPRKINWTPVLWGIILQFSLGLLILRWRTGYRACEFVGQQVTTFLGYTQAGTVVVFGEKYTDHPVVFQILPTVVFFSAIVSILYYLGAMQVVIKVIAFLIQYTLQTTPIESFAAAAQIFLGSIEITVALKPFLGKLTRSELHAVMVGGYATVAGTVIAAYVEFGVPAEHVISASFMSAPAALAIAKLSLPETEVSSIRSQKEITLPSGQESNMIEALAVGAIVAIKLVANVVVNLIAFLACLAFVDSALSYFGSMVDFPELSFAVICSYLFMPLAAAMGVSWDEANVVGALIGKKFIVSEFLAYVDLGGLISSGAISGRSIVLATYMLCGFSSLPSIGINLGALTSACPERRTEFAQLALRAMINGNIACFMTACIAGLLYQTAPPGDVFLMSNSTSDVTSLFNTTTLVPLLNASLPSLTNTTGLI